MVLTAIVVGFVVGFALALPPGPIAVAVIKQALEGRFRDGFQIAISAAGMDILYAMIAAFASSAIVSTLTDAIVAREWLMLLFQGVCVVVLIALGVRYFRATTRDVAKSREAEEVQEEKARRLGLKSPTMMGVMIAITNLASPTFIPTLVFVVGYLHANGWVESGPWSSITYSVGFGLGAFAWFSLLLRILFKLRKSIPANFIGRIYKTAGATFFVFAAIILYHVVTKTKWTEVF